MAPVGSAAGRGRRHGRRSGRAGTRAAGDVLGPRFEGRRHRAGIRVRRYFVVSNARNFRMEQFLPLLVPEVNPDHLELIPLQQQSKGWKGAIVTNPNCATVPLVMASRPLVISSRRA